jgi:type VI secretion system secreted protein VgrG
MPFLEANRYLYLTTPLGDDKLLLRSFQGNEGLSRLFHFELDLEADNATTVDFDKLIGQKVSFGIQGADPGQTPRHFSGIVIELGQGARDQRLTTYSMTVAPEIWKLSCIIRSRIFQHLNIPDILKKLFTGYDVTYEIQGTFEPREYVVQYQESDLDFASRLMEEEGIYYFFKFTKGAHKLVLANTPPSHPDIPGGSQVIFEADEGGGRAEERISSWNKEQYWGSGKYTLWDHHFQLPHKKLDAEQIVMDSVQAGKITHKLKLSGNEDMEVYENPGRYAQRFDGIDRSGGEKAADLQKIFTDNKRTIGIRMQQEETTAILIHAGSNHWQMTAGHKFALQRHFNADGQYVVTSVSHDAGEGGFHSGVETEKETEKEDEEGKDEGDHYGNSFDCIPYALKFSPPRITRRPIVSGPQSALVVGPPGEEIFTDKYGRVKVQFHWDREGTLDADSSCWLRVATSWAGQKWGSIHIPRIGQEVIVGFLEGDPDRPLVTGSVYNADMMPPYDLPANKTQSGVKSRSSKGGGSANYNEIMFEDLKGSELIRTHAEKDQLLEVENNRTVIIGHDESIKVEHDRTENVKNNETVTVEGARKHYVVGEEQVQTDGDLHLTASQNQNEKVGMTYSRQVGVNMYDKAGMNYAVDAGMMIHLKSGMTAVIEAGMGLTIKSSGGSIDINPMGIFIQGNLVFINSGAANLSGCGSSPTSPTSPGEKKLDGMKNDVGSAAAAAAASSIAQQVQQQSQQATSMATNLVQSVGQQAFGAISQVASQAVNAAAQAGQTTPAAAQQVLSQINSAVAQAQSSVANAADQAQAMVNTGMNAVRTGVQQAVNQTSAAVAQAETQAAQAAQAAQQQLQNAAQQAQAAAQQAAAAGQQALNQGLQQGQQMLNQAQAMEQQAQQQLQVAQNQAQALANQAQQAGQQALNQASQQLSQTADQAQQTAQGAANQAQAAANQLGQTASQAAAQGQQEIAGAAGQAQQAAQQATQAAQQTATQAQQAATQAGQQAQQMEQQTQQQMQQATQAAGQQVGQAANQASQQVNQATQQATTQAAQAGQMSQQAAQQVQNQVGGASQQAAQTVGNTASSAYSQAGSSVNQASQNMSQGMKGLGI